MLSMGKFAEPDTGTSSFSMVLGPAPFLDGKYTIFGRVVGGDHVLTELEKLETVTEGIFVKPKGRVEIVSATVVQTDRRGGLQAPPGLASAICIECLDRARNEL
jgi:cyclophilin family peptidyl-prolyl cis-trans isomerase